MLRRHTQHARRNQILPLDNVRVRAGQFNSSDTSSNNSSEVFVTVTNSQATGQA